MSGQAALYVQGTVSVASGTGSAAVKSVDEEAYLKPCFTIMIGFYSPHLKDFTKKLYCQSQTIYWVTFKFVSLLEHEDCFPVRA